MHRIAARNLNYFIKKCTSEYTDLINFNLIFKEFL